MKIGEMGGKVEAIVEGKRDGGRRGVAEWSFYARGRDE